MSRTRHNPIYVSAGWLALCGLLLQILLPLIHHPMAAMAMQPMGHCGMGPAMSPEAAPAQKSPLKKTPSCPICQTLHQLAHGFVPPDAPIAGTAIRHFAFIALPPATRPVSGFVASGAWPRAPPQFA